MRGSHPGSGMYCLLPGVGLRGIEGFRPWVRHVLLPGVGLRGIEGFRPWVRHVLLPAVGLRGIEGFRPWVRHVLLPAVGLSSSDTYFLLVACCWAEVGLRVWLLKVVSLR